ncbi:hypothetical protein [Clostridium sp. UBA4548]|uniref:hypothetical protein n=1 Tax=Clostridium sp. UBA4548 TaxID=1946361 RepID=UPI0025C4B23B|nr:hypothetical protein [Clostridium sp. UBA4548]
MENLEAAIERLKIMECPTGEVEKKIANILEEYEVCSKSSIEVVRNESYDENEAQGYVAKINGSKALTVLAISGMDDYVAKVVDVHEC